MPGRGLRNHIGPQTVATFVIQKILLDDNGLQYICATAERFYAVSTVLGNMVGQLGGQAALLDWTLTNLGSIPGGGTLISSPEAYYTMLSATVRERPCQRGSEVVSSNQDASIEGHSIAVHEVLLGP